jgi:4-hydroxy-4-methyl-2-oxoglutarate aldolase
VTDAARLAALGTATIGEAAPEARVLDVPLRPLAPGMRLAGPARTVRCRPGDNLALHRVIAAAGAGDVIVADYGGSTRNGPFGEIMAIACMARGVAGLVIHGAVRDTAQIVALGFPVFACGCHIRGTTKIHPGVLGVTLTIGGARLRQGDMMVADDDAVIALPADRAGPALEAAEARTAAEARMIDRLRAGETTLQILGLEQEGPS